MKKIIFVFMIIMFITSIFGKVFVVGIYNVSPFFYAVKNKNTLVFNGLIVDILKDIANKENWEIKFIYGSKEELLNKLKNNEIDLLPTFMIGENFSDIIEDTENFSMNSLYISYFGIMHKKDIDFYSVKDKVFAIKKGDFLIDFSEVFNKIGKIIEVNDLNEKIEALEKNKANFAVISPQDMENAVNFIHRYSFEIHPMRLVFQKNNNLDEKILSKIDYYIDKYKKDNKSIYYKLLDKYIYLNTGEIPKWLYYSIFLFLIIFIVSFVTALYYKKRYEKSLIQLKKKNEELSVKNKVAEDLLKANKTLFLKFSKVINIISEFSVSKYTIQEFSEKILNEILELIPDADYGSISLINNNKIFFLSAVGHNLEQLRKVHMVNDDFKRGVDSNVTVYDNIIEKYNGINKELLKKASKEIKKSAVYKIRIKDELYINICVDKKDKIDFSQDSLEIFKILGDLSSVYFKNRIFLGFSIYERKKAEKSNKIKTEFLSNMSHDIRTPLNGINGMLYILESTKLNNLQKKYLKMLKNSTRVLSSLVNDILDLSKLESNEIYIEDIAFNIENEIEEVVDTNAYDAHIKGLELNYYIDENVPKELKGDSTKLKQILNNILSNAIKFTEKGEVYLEIKSHNIGLDINRIEIMFQIKDTGVGIEKKNLEKIFKPFVQEKAEISRLYGGTGLGLSIVYKLVKLLGGEIKVESTINKGTLFIINLPFKIENDEYFEAEEFIKFPEKKVLIVDDNNTNRFIIKEYIKTLGMKYDEAENGKEALKKLHQEEFDIVLIDNQMPEMTGLELAEEINKELKEVKKILLTSLLNNDKNIEKDIINYKFDAIIAKPIKRKDLINSIISIFKTDIIMNNTESNIKISNKIKILYVDDNEINREVGKLIIESFGPTVITIENGRESIEILKNSYFDMVFMDIQMPIMDGYETTKKIREFNKSIPIIAMTAHAMQLYKEKAIKSGMNDFITKPIEKNTVLQIIKKYCKDIKIRNIENKKLEQDLIDINYYTHFNEKDFMKRVLNKKSLALKILDKYIDDTEKNIKNLKIALDKKEEKEIKFYAHTVKGSSKNVSANQLAIIAERIEKYKDIKEAIKDYSNLLKEFKNLKEEINKFLKEGR
ncbi:hypothetical protein JCM30566_14340 [Marinitoga arctica]